MDTQSVMNIVVGVLLTVLGWLLNELWSAHKILAKDHHDHVKEVATGYVSKEDFKEQLDHIRSTCDNIWRAIRKGE